ncbi:DUF4446 family protein [Paenibacillus rhizovicinus]|uniref:DUF4446 family protein n=1 Tax=Paenibacillus rhizovicinus TaxID=2704463 RepID=A0A6C0P1G0_9BACL|nr:DUF4446 family protein [Paenibacillus rhizovicinus]QHW32201.1 DUF4446 family protein [Paenibacillus rhizovicinus]
MDQWIERPFDWVSVGLLVVVLLLLIRNFVLGSKLKKLRKNYTQFMNGTGVEGLEDVIIQIKDQLQRQEEQQRSLKQTVTGLSETLKRKKGNIGIHRYNAFADRGSDLSFSVALVNDEKDGMVLSGIHGRDETFVYAKPLKEGQSAYALTPEEIEAINLALQQEK